MDQLFQATTETFHQRGFAWFTVYILSLLFTSDVFKGVHEETFVQFISITYFDLIYGL